MKLFFILENLIQFYVKGMKIKFTLFNGNHETDWIKILINI